MMREAGWGRVINIASAHGLTASPFKAAYVAAKHGVVIVPNLFERGPDQGGPHPPTYDSSPVIDGDGTILGVTRMVHITDYEHFHEQGYYAPGDTGAPVYDTWVGKLGVAICYDRHYGEYMRALALGGADVVSTVCGASGTSAWTSVVCTGSSASVDTEAASTAEAGMT